MRRHRSILFFVALALALALSPAVSSAAPLVYIQLLARPDGTDQPFSSTITPTSVGEEFDWIVVATLAPAGTQNTNLPVDANGNQQIGSWQASASATANDGLGGTVYSTFESSSAGTQVSFQNSGYVGIAGRDSIDQNIFNGIYTNPTKSGSGTNSKDINGNASFTGGVNTISYAYTTTATTQSPAGHFIPQSVAQTAAGYALFQNFGGGSGASGGSTAARSATNLNNDLVGELPVAAISTPYLGVNPAIVNASGTNQSPISVILASGSNAGGATYNNGGPLSSGGGDASGNDSTFQVTSLGSGNSTLSINASDMTAGFLGSALTATTDFLNIQYHDTAGTQVKPGHFGSFEYAAQTDSDPVVQYTSLTINGIATNGNTAVLNFTPTTYSFGSVLKNGVATLGLALDNTPGNGTDAATFSGVASNGAIGVPASGMASAGTNWLPVTLNASGTATNGPASWTYTIANTTPGSTDTGGAKTATITANIGNATADTSNQLYVSGPALTSPVAPGASFAGLSSTVTGGNGATNPGPGSITGTTGAALEYTTATILAGAGGADGAFASMAWRSRTLSETSVEEGGTASIPPLLSKGLSLHSDVLSLPGLGNPFVLQMSYDPTYLGGTGAAGIAEQSQLFAGGLLYLAWFEGEWENAYSDDIADNAFISNPSNFLGSFDAFEVIYGSNLGSYLGAWGIDPVNDEAWVVLGGYGNSGQYAVVGETQPVVPVPERSAFVLAAFGVLGLLLHTARVGKVRRGRVW